MPLLAFLSDFGSRDWYVAAMKGAALARCPEARLVDITHEITPGDIAGGAFVLSQCWEAFPRGTVFVAVVDPGVGTDRHAVAVEAAGRLFVGPDNGLFGWLQERMDGCHRLENPSLLPTSPSDTFHGRDVFAPVAASLASGAASLADCGPSHARLQATGWPEPEFERAVAHGQVLYLDHFGNAITNLSRSELNARYDLSRATVSLHPRHVPLARTFGDVPAGHPLAYFGSGGLLEIGINGGNAARMLDLRPGLHLDVLASPLTD